MKTKYQKTSILRYCLIWGVSVLLSNGLSAHNVLKESMRRSSSDKADPVAIQRSLDQSWHRINTSAASANSKFPEIFNFKEILGRLATPIDQNTLVLLDIDDCIIKSCESHGATQFWRDSAKSFSVKSGQNMRLMETFFDQWLALSDATVTALVDPYFHDFLKHCKEADAIVLGFTARRPSSQQVTRRQMHRHGIEFTGFPDLRFKKQYDHSSKSGKINTSQNKSTFKNDYFKGSQDLNTDDKDTANLAKFLDLIGPSRSYEAAFDGNIVYCHEFNSKGDVFIDFHAMLRAYLGHSFNQLIFVDDSQTNVEAIDAAIKKLQQTETSAPEFHGFIMNPRKVHSVPVRRNLRNRISKILFSGYIDRQRNVESAPAQLFRVGEDGREYEIEKDGPESPVTKEDPDYRSKFNRTASLDVSNWPKAFNKGLKRSASKLSSLTVPGFSSDKNVSTDAQMQESSSGTKMELDRSDGRKGVDLASTKSEPKLEFKTSETSIAQHRGSFEGSTCTSSNQFKIEYVQIPLGRSCSSTPKDETKRSFARISEGDLTDRLLIGPLSPHQYFLGAIQEVH